MTKPNFARDLKVGQAGERAFIELAAQYKLNLTQTDGRAGDLIDEKGDVYELKSDSYDMGATPNFFIELYSDVDKGKLGGPAQALANGCSYYVYYFTKNQVAFIFETQDLMWRVDNYIALNQPKHIEIKNRSWTTIGIKIPRDFFSPVCVLKKEAK